MTPAEDDFRAVPAALRQRSQWLVWRFEQKPGEKKPRKVPYYASGGRRVGTQGDDADRARLVTFDLAVAAIAPGGYSGLGFAFLPGDGLIGIDLDNKVDLDTGEIDRQAESIIRACGSYTEYSPSGKGFHIYSLGETTSCKSNEIGVEMFCGRQFFTVTGRQYPGSPKNVTALETKVVDGLRAMIEKARARPRTGLGQAPAPARMPAGAGERADRERIESALAAVSADVGYNDWIAVGMALYDSLGEDIGLSVWDFWSSKGSKYAGRKSLEGHWRSFGNRPPGGDGVIFKLAMSAGWKRPKAPPASRASSPSGAAERGKAPPEDGAPPPWVTEDPPGSDSPVGRSQRDLFFRKNREGNIQPSLFNTLQVLESDTAWDGVLGFNQFSYRITKRRVPPGDGAAAGEWADIDDVRLQVYLTKTHKFEPKKTTVMDAVMQAAYAAQYHPVREYLDDLEWDGVDRLSGLLAEFWGASSTPTAAALRLEDPDAYLRFLRYLEMAGRKWLIGAVARIFQPGCKLDTMIVFEGGQGDFKSTAVRALFGDEWFSDSKLTIGDKDALAQMQGKWAYELAEMDAHRKADDTAFKQFITTQVDRVRWHYGRRAEDVPRQCVFVGTTNMHQYGKDETGMRRIWPLEVGVVDVEGIRAVRDQLWAEAVALFRGGFTWWVDKRTVALEEGAAGPAAWSEWALFDEQGESRQIVDAWATPITEWIALHSAVDHFSTAQIMGDALGLDRARWSPPEQKRVAAIMRRLGYRQKKVGPKDSRAAGWVRADVQPVPAVPDGGIDVPI